MIDPVLVEFYRLFLPVITCFSVITALVLNTVVYLVSDENEYKRVMQILKESEDRGDE